jgi:hypothetical protein
MKSMRLFLRNKIYVATLFGPFWLNVFYIGLKPAIFWTSLLQLPMPLLPIY